MRKKKTWTVNETDYYYNQYYYFDYINNYKYYFTRNETTNEWSEIIERRQNDKTVETTLNKFKLKTFDTDSLILYSDTFAQHLELSEDKAKLTFGAIEQLDSVRDFYTGYWMDTDPLRNKNNKIFLILKKIY